MLKMCSTVECCRLVELWSSLLSNDLEMYGFLKSEKMNFRLGFRNWSLTSIRHDVWIFPSITTNNGYQGLY